MQKKYKIVIFLLLWAINFNAQTITVSSFKLLDTDLTANTTGTMEKDQNGETAALIKVVTTQTGFTFDGGALGIVKSVQKPSEIWVYVPKGLKKITISHPQLGMLRDYYLTVPIEAARTYEMVLVSGAVQTVVKQARTSQYVVFQLTPSNAVVELNGELLNTNGGTAIKLMKFGTYDYRVQAPDHFPEAGKVTIDNPEEKYIVNISLKPNYSKVTLTVDNNAEIWMNGNMKGLGSWTGNLGAGTYEIETKKNGHRSASITKDIIVTEDPQTIQLPSPTPIYGDADISSNPAMADIYIDGNEVGQTPKIISKLLIGEHEVRISKEGYYDIDTSIVIKENEIYASTIVLKKKIEDEKMEFNIGDVHLKMIQVKGGVYWIQKGVGRHQVSSNSFYIAETEVTQELWEMVMGYNPSHTKGATLPVEQVSWDECQDFINKLNKRTGKKFRLPTETEWEIAARGGNKSNGYRYSGSDFIDAVAVRNRIGTNNVKSKKPNELGIYDMTGNVGEWCDDSRIIGSIPEKIYRGGSYNQMHPDVNSRDSASKDYRSKCIGLRLAHP